MYRVQATTWAWQGEVSTASTCWRRHHHQGDEDEGEVTWPDAVVLCAVCLFGAYVFRLVLEPGCEADAQLPEDKPMWRTKTKTRTKAK